MSTSLTDFFAAMHHGAASIYHQVLQAEQTITYWTADNPALKELLNEGVAFGTQFLVAIGVPQAAIDVGIPAVVGALRVIAASDATVQSLQMSPTAVVTAAKE